MSTALLAMKEIPVSTLRLHLPVLCCGDTFSTVYAGVGIRGILWCIIIAKKDANAIWSVNGNGGKGPTDCN